MKETPAESIKRLADRALLDARMDAMLKTDETMAKANESRMALHTAIDAAIEGSALSVLRYQWIVSHCWNMRWSFHRNGELKALHLEVRPSAIASQAVQDDISRGVDAARALISPPET